VRSPPNEEPAEGLHRDIFDGIRPLGDTTFLPVVSFSLESAPRSAIAQRILVN
jgi:hypothetical protein